MNRERYLMLRRTTPVLGLVVLLTVLVALAQAGPAVGRTTAGQAGTPGATPDGAVRDTLTVEDVVGALRGAGLTVQDNDETIALDLFAVPARRLIVDGAEVQVHVYADIGAREQDSNGISGGGTIVGERSVDWIARPRFTPITNLLVLLLTDDDELAARVETALLGLMATATPTASPVASPGASPATGAPGPADDVAAALRAAGLTVEDTGQTVRQPFFAPVGHVLRVNGADMQVYVYPTVTDREAAQATINPDGSIGTTMVTWIAPPHVASAGTVLTVLLTADEGLAATVARAVSTLD